MATRSPGSAAESWRTEKQRGDLTAPDVFSAWTRILAARAGGISGPDLTMSPLWAESLQATHLAGREWFVVVARCGDDVAGVLPVVRAGTGSALARGLAPVASLYGGRLGLLTQPGQPEALEKLLTGLARSGEPWDVMKVSVLKGSDDEAAMRAAAAKCGIKVLELASTDSPYVPLPASWDELFESLHKKYRWTIRNGEKRLTELGRLEYRHCDTAESSAQFLKWVEGVERGSWKDAAGTSIARNPAQQRFYEHFIPRAGAAGVLSGHILLLNERPIAYVMGLIDGNVFLDLKESFDAEFDKLSPAHVLKKFVMTTLIGRGVTLYDFMGECDDYKMKWTRSTYTNSTLALYRGNVRGRLAWLRAKLGARLAKNR